MFSPTSAKGRGGSDEMDNTDAPVGTSEKGITSKDYGGRMTCKPAIDQSVGKRCKKFT